MSKTKVQHTVVGIANLNARSRAINAGDIQQIAKNNGQAKHHDKQVVKLAARRAGAPKGDGFTRPGSMNPKKQG